MKKVIVILNYNDYFFKYILDYNIKIVSIFHFKSKFFLKIGFKLKFLFEKLALFQIKITKSTDIVIFDSVNTLFPNLSYNIFCLTGSKPILFIWNMLSEKIKNFDNFRNIYSFSHVDCGKYGYHYLTLFAYKISVKKNVCKKCTYDFYFCGKTKNREKNILKYFQLLSHFCCRIDLVENINKYVSVDNSEIYYSKKYIDYSKYICRVLSSKCIIDITDGNQDGYTLRIAEAIIYNKKIITNNANIKKEAIYNSNNVFILNPTSTMLDISDFLNKSTIQYDYEDTTFNFYNWINEIFK